MTDNHNETAGAQAAAARRVNLIARALLDAKRIARFEPGRDARETRVRLFAEIDGQAYFLAFTLRDQMLRDLGAPLDEAMQSLARDVLDGEGDAAPAADDASTARAAEEPSNGPACAAHAAQVVKALRRRLKLSQDAFARRYGIPVGTLRDWEQARRAPDACGQAYLAVIAGAPEIVPEALPGPSVG